MREAKERILRLLKSAGDGATGGYVSGQSISSELGISRAAVWKHIKDLRKRGFHIEASPSKGYRLIDDTAPFNGAAIGAGLATEFIGRPLYFYERIDSTNTKAVELARAGSPEGTAVVADAQTRGRGRLERRWISPPGVNLYTSLILRPPIPPVKAPELTLMAAVALAEAVGSFTDPTPPAVKWPNDVLLGAKKVGGILTEMHSEPDRVNFVVIGIGVNINMDMSHLPGGLKRTATTLKHWCGRPLSRTTFAQTLYSSLEKWYKQYLAGGFAVVRDAWRGFFTGEGKPVSVRSVDRVVEGVCLGLAEDGALLVRTPSGTLERVLSGDLVIESGP